MLVCWRLIPRKKKRLSKKNSRRRCQDIHTVFSFWIVYQSFINWLRILNYSLCICGAEVPLPRLCFKQIALALLSYHLCYRWYTFRKAVCIWKRLTMTTPPINPSWVILLWFTWCCSWRIWAFEWCWRCHVIVWSHSLHHFIFRNIIPQCWA